MNIAVIGAGAAGLCAARHSAEAGNRVTVFEQTDVIGGTWVYTDKIGKDDYGMDIHSSMYQGLMYFRSNFQLRCANSLFESIQVKYTEGDYGLSGFRFPCAEAVLHSSSRCVGIY